MTREKRNEMECEEGRKIESNSEVDRDRDRLSKGVEGESEKNAKMHGSPAGGYSTRTKRATRGWYMYRGGKRSLERGTAMREESGGRANTRMTRGEARGERRRVREETERVQGECKRGSGRERKGEKERRCAGKRGGTRYRKCEKERKGEREKGYERKERMKAGGREGERERKRAAARSAEGARRPHMCSETNVRSECRLLPIIRCRGVPLCARGWSADSVPRFYAAR